ncbi:unnamed protein product [Ranitomeya imitator]|uniref:Neutral ceramidase n=1 Tax=Ranitomeya imitator TaxID=111125 RepID=A0ABN9KS81_9NEOB|nr:unnamed protein product [Ranitomeya imitator]
MGYASGEQRAGGLHTRLYSRAFIVAEPDNSKRVVFVSADIGMVSQRVRLEVMNILESKYNGLYRQDNVILSGTHTHSGPGGYFQYTIFRLISGGFSREATDAIVNGIVKASVVRRCVGDATHDARKNAAKRTQKRCVLRHVRRFFCQKSDARKMQLVAFSWYPFNTDKQMVIMKMVDMNGREVGLVSWFAVHAVSMPVTNHLVSSDNMGHASYLFEQVKNTGSLPGEVTTCIATGPGDNVFDSTKIIGEQIFERAVELYNSSTKEMLDTVNSAHQWVDMSNVTVKINETHTATTCKPALGYSFGAGTIDGPGLINFTQGMTEGNPFWDGVRDFLFGVPSNETIECHEPKPILLNTGEVRRGIPWHPTIIDVQMITIGSLAILAVPGEFTTMSGRRLREAVKKELDPSGAKDIDVVVSGLSNVYTHYITTFEEYQGNISNISNLIIGVGDTMGLCDFKCQD